MSDQNKMLVQRVFDEIYNEGNLAAVDEIVANDFVVYLPSDELHGAQGIKQYVAALRAGFPDIHVTIEDMVSEGDRVVTRWTARGTHTGEFQGIPPTGNEVRVTGTDIDRFVDGKAVECWTTMDELGLMQQLGVIPTPEPATG